jgi:hypothetical protein
LCLIAYFTKMRCSDVRVERCTCDLCHVWILYMVRDGNYLPTPRDQVVPEKSVRNYRFALPKISEGHRFNVRMSRTWIGGEETVGHRKETVGHRKETPWNPGLYYLLTFLLTS